MSLFLPKLSDLLTLYSKKTCDALHMYVFRIIWNIGILPLTTQCVKSYGNYHRDTTMVLLWYYLGISGVKNDMIW